jgi:hypothetical protein
LLMSAHPLRRLSPTNNPGKPNRGPASNMAD